MMNIYTQETSVNELFKEEVQTESTNSLSSSNLFNGFIFS